MNSGDEQALLNTPYSNADYGVRNSPWNELTTDSGSSLSQALGSFWRAQTAGWLFFALFGFVSRILAFDDLKLAIVLTLSLDTAGFLLTAFAHGLFRDRIRHQVSLSIVITAMALSVIAGALQMLVAEMVRNIVHPATTGEFVIGTFTVSFVYYTLIFMGWSLAYLWINAEANALKTQIQNSQAQKAILHAELSQLRSQLDSHFLFNALNTVAMEIPENKHTALEMTNRVAAYLRYSLEHHDQRVCSLMEEIRAVQNYLRIQEIRFENQIECAYDVAPETRLFLVPHLIVQPLVENAVKHGLTSPGQLAIKLRATGNRNELTIVIRNSGRLVNKSHDRPTIGLSNMRRRLELHYPGNHDFSLFQVGEEVVARLNLRGRPCFV
ncbi:sensor histidine kinase [Brucella cytisi]|uniref:sensor histidine kinase n=1 Tax=Brucella cytisi TaxID=407152 RepID=UPI0035D7BDF0